MVNGKMPLLTVRVEREESPQIPLKESLFEGSGAADPLTLDTLVPAHCWLTASSSLFLFERLRQQLL